MKKRIGSLLLVLVMVITMIPAAVYANVSISEIQINELRAPRAGERPDYDIDISDSRYETVDPGIYREDLKQCNNGIVWFRVDKTSGSEVEKILVPTDTFEIGKKYRARIFVKPTSGNSYANTVSAGVSEMEALGYSEATVSTPSGHGNTDYKVVAYTHECTVSAIDTVEITGLELPEAGAAPDDDCNILTDGVFVNFLSWSMDDGSAMNTDTFVAGETYKLTLWLRTNFDQGYFFKMDGYENLVQVLINGIPFEKTETTDTSYTAEVEYEFYVPYEVIHSIDIVGLDEPEVGMKPDFEVSPTTAGYDISAVEWWDITSSPASKVEAEETFVGGHQYRVTFDATAQENYKIYYDPEDEYKEYFFTATVNGKIATKTSSCEGDPAYFQYDFAALPKNVIEEIYVTGIDGPVAGNTPDYDGVLSTEGVEIAKIIWRDHTGNKDLTNGDGQTFVAGHTYEAIVSARIKNEYKYKHDGEKVTVDAYINGILADSGLSGPGAPEFDFGITFDTTPYKAANKIAVSGFDVPTAGAIIDLTGNISGTGITAGDCYWYDMTAGKKLAADAKFEAGHSYKLVVTVNADTNYIFPLNDQNYPDGTKITATINGQAVQFEASGSSKVATVFSTYEIPALHIHNWKAATCTTPKTCTRCKVTEGSALGHKKVTIAGKAATCTATGLTAGEKCSVCGKVTKKQQTIAATGHKAGTAKVTVKATATKSGKKVSKCTVCGTTVKTTVIKPAKVTLSKTAYTYTGKKVKAPTVRVKTAAGKTISSKYYTVTKPKNVNKMKAIGKYTYTVKFKSSCPEYKGTVKLTMEIKPNKTSITSNKAAKKAITVKWKKGKKAQVTGYQIMVATNSKFTKNKKTATVKGYSKVSKKMTKLKAKTKYYVKVRTYKTVKGVKIYSNWSKVKTCKTK